ncbi:FMN-binding negative transcriptional regulator [Stutzerimonas kirkiae]|uniref:FMN-binding negative transcriptional regulator n=1 Tax=Stutzerimonas kirkiae TaxID=2211392 RepID=UPI0010383C97|nr:FMN-binding negative transcriptional regulator [Stutzerimonas kirkiae]TBV15382.1 transcriptional regulator [Stutzerimonas kirkiae]
MFTPKHFAAPSVEVMHQLIQASPLATLVTLSSRGLEASHIPLHLSAAPGAPGVLRGHVARANPLWKDLDAGGEALAIFHGPNAYITPSWYPTKQRTGKAVPTWNYVVVHAYGRLRAIDDPHWLRTQLDQLTAHTESGQAEPWRVDDAPTDYTEKLLKAIVGIELVVSRLEGTWKTSQNQPAENQAGIIQGLTASAGDLDMVHLVEASGKQA